MRYLLFIVVVCCEISAHAQYNNIGYFRHAEQLLAQKDYYAAAQYYERFLTVDKKARASAQPFAVEKKMKGRNNLNPRQEAVYHLAQCYFELHDLRQAEKRYRQACAFPLNVYPESRYWLGKALLANGHYQEALETFDAFIKDYTQMGPVLNDADRQVDNLRFIQGQLRKPDLHAYRLMQQSMPGATSAYALTTYKNDSIVFTGIHSSSGPGGYRNDLYEAVAAADSPALAGARILKGQAGPDSNLHNGLATFPPDGKRMFYTRWTKVEGVSHAAIWSREKLDTGWSQPLLSGQPLNMEGYNSTQPFITKDGKYLLFASDRPGGQGKYDLWYAVLDSNFQALSASNLGDRVNSPGDEGSPYYHQNSRTLVFSSNGRVGMGGLDLYYSKGFFNLSQWDVPENPGIPLNSSKDDAYFISTDEDNCWNTGWLSSDRDSGCCLALYTVTQDNVQYISGRVVDCDGHKPVKGARLTVTDDRHPGRVLTEQHTDSTGSYSFRLQNISRYSMLAEKPGYVSDRVPYVVYMRTSRDTIANETVCLRPVVTSPPVIRRSSILGNFPYKRSSLPVSAYLTLDSLVLVLREHEGTILQVEGYTDGIGGDAYNIRLAQARVDVCIRYLVKKGIPLSRLRGRSFGKCCPVAPETIDGKDNAAGREQNRRVEFKVLQ